MVVKVRVADKRTHMSGDDDGDVVDGQIGLVVVGDRGKDLRKAISTIKKICQSYAHS